MKMSALQRTLVAALFISVTVAGATDIEALTREVRRLVEVRDWPGALLQIETARRNCGSDKRCRVILDYSTGYVWQRVAENAPDEEANLERAARAYKRVLDVQRGHSPTLANLAAVYERLGQSEERRRVLQMGAHLDGTKATPFALQLGDLLQRQVPPDWNGALRAYQRAARVSPGDPAPPQRIVIMHRRMPIQEIRPQFLGSLAKWEEHFPSVARDGYEVVVEITRESQPKLAAEALLGWVRLLGKADTISSEQVRSAVHGFAERTGVWHGVNDELRTAVEELNEALTVPQAGSWFESQYWSRTDQRREALAGLKLSVGRAFLLDGRLEAAESCWKTARDSAPNSGGKRAWLELTTSLATLYSTNPRFRPGSFDTLADDAFDALENELFVGKGNAYASNDLAAIQRFHTVLALIYSERNQWVSDEQYRNALFQSSRAIHTAEKRKEFDYDPLPYIKQLRAEGMAAVAKDAELRETFYSKPEVFLDDRRQTHPDLEREAGMAYLEASRAYLDADALEGAANMLQNAEEAGISGPTSEGAEALGNLIEERRVMQSVMSVTASAPGPVPDCTSTELTPAPQGVPKNFWDRQQFKILSDCVAAGNSLDLEYDASRALILAVDGGVALAGAGDAWRMQVVQEKVATAIGVSLDTPVMYSRNSSPPSGRPSRPVFIDPSVVIGARVVNELGPGERPEVRVRGDEVTVEQAEATPREQKEVKKRLRSLDQVRAVKVKQKSQGS